MNLSWPGLKLGKGVLMPRTCRYQEHLKTNKKSFARFQLNTLLPRELLEWILVTAAAQRKIAHPKAPLHRTYVLLASVCRLWRDILKDATARRRVKQRLCARGR